MQNPDIPQGTKASIQTISPERIQQLANTPGNVVYEQVEKKRMRDPFSSTEMRTLIGKVRAYVQQANALAKRNGTQFDTDLVRRTIVKKDPRFLVLEHDYEKIWQLITAPLSPEQLAYVYQLVDNLQETESGNLTITEGREKAKLIEEKNRIAQQVANAAVRETAGKK